MATTTTQAAKATPRGLIRVERRGRPRLSRTFTHSILPRIVLVLGAAVFLSPFYWMVVSALKTLQEGTTLPPTLIPHSWAWSNFVEAITFIPFPLYTFNSLVITVGATIGAILSNTAIAYGFSRIQWPGRNVLFYV